MRTRIYVVALVFLVVTAFGVVWWVLRESDSERNKGKIRAAQAAVEKKLVETEPLLKKELDSEELGRFVYAVTKYQGVTRKSIAANPNVVSRQDMPGATIKSEIIMLKNSKTGLEEKMLFEGENLRYVTSLGGDRQFMIEFDENGDISNYREFKSNKEDGIQLGFSGHNRLLEILRCVDGKYLGKMSKWDGAGNLVKSADLKKPKEIGEDPFDK